MGTGWGRVLANDLLARYNLSERVTFVTRDSLTFLAETTDSYDLILLDGNHEAPQVYREIALASHRLRSGRVIVLHDYFPRLRPMGAAQHFLPGPALAVRRLVREHPSLAAFPLSPLPWPALGHVTTSTLAVLGRRC